jgi:hypothetical protein
MPVDITSLIEHEVVLTEGPGLAIGAGVHEVHAADAAHVAAAQSAGDKRVIRSSSTRLAAGDVESRVDSRGTLARVRALRTTAESINCRG